LSLTENAVWDVATIQVRNGGSQITVNPTPLQQPLPEGSRWCGGGGFP
jgi:hypothetical protein